LGRNTYPYWAPAFAGATEIRPRPAYIALTPAEQVGNGRADGAGQRHKRGGESGGDDHDDADDERRDRRGRDVIEECTHRVVQQPRADQTDDETRHEGAGDVAQADAKETLR